MMLVWVSRLLMKVLGIWVMGNRVGCGIGLCDGIGGGCFSLFFVGYLVGGGWIDVGGG